MLSEQELENYYRLLRALDPDSIALALKLSRTAKLTGLDALYRELIHICRSMEHPENDRFPYIEKGRKNPERILFVNQTSVLYFRKQEELRLLSYLRHFNPIRKIQCWELNLYSVPESICDVESLQILNLGNNFLQKLPDSLVRLGNLREIYLISNSFSVFPEVLLKMEQLEEIQLGMNKISSLPDKIADLKNLKVLALSANRIQHLPESLKEMKSLRILSLGENPIPKSEIEEFRKVMDWCRIY